MLCNECPKRETCRELCKEAEAYVNQDHVGMKETRLPDKEFIPAEWPQLSTSEAILKLYFLDHKPQAEIAEIVMVSRQCVSQTLKRYKGRIVKNLQKRVDSTHK